MSVGRSTLLRRNTTKCMAIQNSGSDNAPSRSQSDNFQIRDSSVTGRPDFSKNTFATFPLTVP